MEGAKAVSNPKTWSEARLVVSPARVKRRLETVAQQSAEQLAQQRHRANRTVIVWKREVPTLGRDCDDCTLEACGRR
eukprot:9252027-Pyramimonas_sp.AAC.1